MTYIAKLKKFLTPFTVIFYSEAVDEQKSAKTWTKTRIQNLWRHRSGIYYGRLNRKGKDQWRCLKTELLKVAKARLREFTGEVEKSAAPTEAQNSGKMTFGEAATLFLERLKSSGLGLRGRRSNRKRITESSIHYRDQTVQALLKSWPELETTDVRKISEVDCENGPRSLPTAILRPGTTIRSTA